ncbi:hypothetical protein BCR34DRAFT_557413 [Clohesyomyces aquaticus]|uniref:Uncharacterized protein n=1 Tax=Clohesyomyces aquaticus TaxID=1231657 RepID=A0A1Y2A2K3_9PLEO|nr:hypothetical protein BCR34DRAFT_557413 [Clohesyomyces aquaticus]
MACHVQLVLPCRHRDRLRVRVPRGPLKSEKEEPRLGRLLQERPGQKVHRDRTHSQRGRNGQNSLPRPPNGQHGIARHDSQFLQF